jgi:pimeloyl-ACP methyl ester carboxylesterase
MKPDVLLLHGALGCPEQFKPLVAFLQENYTCHVPAFGGHGGVAFGEDFSIAGFAEELREYVTKNSLHKPLVFGYSMGGYVALYLESIAPGTFGKIITLGTKYLWTPEQAEAETQQLNPEMLEEKVPAYVQTLKAWHAPIDWKDLIEKTRHMMLELGQMPALKAEHLSTLSLPCWIGSGDQDKMVPPLESAQMASAIPKAGWYVVPESKHPLEKTNPELLAALIHQFFKR